MCVHGNLIVPLVLCATVALGLALTVSPSGVVKVDQPPNSTVVSVFERRPLTARKETDSADPELQRSRTRRRTRDPDDKNNIESSNRNSFGGLGWSAGYGTFHMLLSHPPGISLWEWLKGRDKHEENCMLIAIGGVASGGALTGAFVGAGIGSIFTGPGALVGGIIGGLVGVFGGMSVGARAGAVTCDSV
uniref:Glycine zipper domain-containing protein n=1 Tax=Anopheles maculatus TaxID=74869 RepID=A0A182SFQ7_9DIPT